MTTITVQIAEPEKDPAEVSALKDQRAAVAGIACSDAAQITGVPLPCSAGAVGQCQLLGRHRVAGLEPLRVRSA